MNHNPLPIFCPANYLPWEFVGSRKIFRRVCRETTKTSLGVLREFYRNCLGSIEGVLKEWEHYSSGDNFWFQFSLLIQGTVFYFFFLFLFPFSLTFWKSGNERKRKEVEKECVFEWRKSGFQGQFLPHPFPPCHSSLLSFSSSSLSISLVP